jgi:hypothetical protein
MKTRSAFCNPILAAIVIVPVLAICAHAQDQNYNANQVMGQIGFDAKTKAEKTAGVWVDDQYVGYVDELKGSKQVFLLPGKHHVSLRQTGYLNSDDEITVNPHAKTVLKVQLQKDPNAQFSSTNAQVKLDVTPDRAAVLVDGKFAGTARDFGGPGKAMLVPPGKHHVVVDLVGYKPFVTDINVQADQKITIKSALIPGSVSEASPSIKKQ